MDYLDAYSRVQSMILDDHDTWDLSTNDDDRVACIRIEYIEGQFDE